MFDHVLHGYQSVGVIGHWKGLGIGIATINADAVQHKLWRGREILGREEAIRMKAQALHGNGKLADARPYIQGPYYTLGSYISQVYSVFYDGNAREL